MFALEDRATGRLVGFAGLVHPGDQPEAEVKYALARTWWRRGLATEAVRHLLEAAASRYGLTDVIATVAPAHAASQRVLAKAGLTRRADRVHDDGTRTVVFGCTLLLAFEVHLVVEANRALLDRVDDDVFDHPVLSDYLTAFLANPANLLAVAVADGTVVGMASGIAYAHPDKPLQLFVNEVGVAARFLRRGAGAAVVDALLRRGRELHDGRLVPGSVLRAPAHRARPTMRRAAVCTVLVGSGGRRVPWMGEVARRFVQFGEPLFGGVAVGRSYSARGAPQRGDEMNILDEDFAAGLLDTGEAPCLSLYQPTHRHHPDNQQDPIRFGNLVKQLEESLLQLVPKDEAQPLLKPFRALEDDRDFWNHALDGLAVLGAKGSFHVYRLQRPVAELAVVADSFHTKPLIRILQSADRYHVLGLSRQEAKLFEGNRDALDEIELHEDVPSTLTDALGEELTEPHLTVASYGGKGASQGSMHHGHGGKSAELDIDAERFFRVIDRGVLEHHSQPSGLPLILAALPEHHHMFHELSHNPALVEESIDVNPDALSSIDELRQRAWEVMEPRYLARLAALVEDFGSAKANERGDDDLAEVAKAVVGGRVATLLIEARRQIPGRVDSETGRLDFDDLEHPEVDDLLDDLGMMALKMGGDVVVVPTERMPTETGIAAIYRY